MNGWIDDQTDEWMDSCMNDKNNGMKRWNDGPIMDRKIDECGSNIYNPCYIYIFHIIYIYTCKI